MKRRFLLLGILLWQLQANAQNDYFEEESNPPKFYLGIGTGINSYTALIGLSGNYRMTDHLFLQGGLGIGGWGYKVSLGIRYDRSLGSGWMYGVGLSSCSGLQDFETELEVQTGDTQDVMLDLNRAYNFNIKVGYNWIIGRDNSFYLEFGYAVPLQSQVWEVTDGSVLSPTSIQVMNFISPGGILLGLGFNFGF